MSGNENNEDAVAQPNLETPNEIRARTTKELNKDMSTKEAYFASLEQWAKQAAFIQMFPNYLFSNYNYPPIQPAQIPFVETSTDNRYLPQTGPQAPQPQLNGPGLGPGPVQRGSFRRFRVLSEAQQQELIQRVGGTEVVVAPFWKRCFAEAIDMIILLILKIIVTYAIFRIFELEMDREMMKKTLDGEDIFVNFYDLSMDFLTLTPDLLLIEMVSRVLVCTYEGLWTFYYSGATPGKSLMKIRIVYVEAVVPLQAQVMPHFFLQPQRALVYPAEVPGMDRALIRAGAKIIVTTILFPICFVMIFFKNNRTAYDIVTKTIVVETNPARAAAPVPQANPPRPHQQ